MMKEKFRKGKYFWLALAVCLCLGLGFWTAATPALADVRLEYDADGNTYVLMDGQQFLLETDDGDPYIIRDDAKTILDAEELAAAMAKEIMPLAEGNHSHTGDADGVEWQAWNTGTSLPNTVGHYYLTTDVKLSTANTISWSPENNTVLCLNGHTITGDPNITGFNQGTIIKITDKTFALVDCQHTGQVTMLTRTSSNRPEGIAGVTEESYSSIEIDTTEITTITKPGANVTIDGVTLTGFGIGINVLTERPVNLTIKNSSITSNSHRGMFINAKDPERSNSTITIENTKINENGQRGIYVVTGRHGTPILNITDSEINGNKAGGARLAGKVTIKDTKIKNNSGASSGGGIYAAELTNLTLDGAEITGNSSGGVYTQANHSLLNDQRIYLKGKLVIKDNVNSGTNTVNNLQIKVDELTTQNGVYRITDVSELADGANIGITKILNTKQTLPIAITIQLNGNSDYEKIAGYFVSDNPGQKVYYNSTDKVLQLDRNNDGDAKHAVAAHTICGLTAECTFENHGHDAEKKVIEANQWEGWNQENQNPPTKTYVYLSGDVELDATWEPESKTVLCLNGYTLSLKEGSTASSVIKPKGTFYLCDCVGTGKIDGANNINNVTGIDVAASNGFRSYYMYGGTITNCKYGVAVSGSSNAYFYMYGGSLSSNRTGLYIYESKANATIYDGEISYNTIHGVWGYKGSFDMQGGEISYNTTSSTSSKQADTYGAGFYNESGCGVSITGGKIINNTAYGAGGGLYLSQGTGTSFTLSNVEITGNKAKGNGAGVHYGIGKELAIGQGTIIKDNVKFVDDPDNAEDYTDNNLYLSYDIYDFRFDYKITLKESESWTGEESIGISFDDEKGLPRNEGKSFTTATQFSEGNDISQRFFSDNPTFKIISYNNSYLAIMYEVPEHKHTTSNGGTRDYYTLEEEPNYAFITQDTAEATVVNAYNLCIAGRTVGKLIVDNGYRDITIEDDEAKAGKIGEIIFGESTNRIVTLNNVRVDSFTVPKDKLASINAGAVIGSNASTAPALVIEDYSGRQFPILDGAEVYGVKITNGKLYLPGSGADIKSITDSSGHTYEICLGENATLEFDNYSFQENLFEQKYSVYVSEPIEDRVIAKVRRNAPEDLLTSATPGWVFEFADIPGNYNEKNIVMKADPNYVPEKPAVTITGQPTAPSVSEGENPVGQDLNVTVSNPENKPLTYQWKYNTTDSTKGGENVPEANGGKTTVCKIPDLEPGEYWFYCEITDGEGNTVTTNTVKVVIPEKKGEVLNPGATIETDEGSTVKRDGDGKTVTIDKGSDGTTDTTITLPENNKNGEVTVDKENGNVTVPEGSTVKNKDENNTDDKTPDITVGKGGGTVTPEGKVKIPTGGDVSVGGDKDGDGKPTTTITGGEGGTTITPKENGTVDVSEGGGVKNDGKGPEVKLPEGGNVDPNGGITPGKDENGNQIAGIDTDEDGDIDTLLVLPKKTDGEGENKIVPSGGDEGDGYTLPDNTELKGIDENGGEGVKVTLPKGGSIITGGVKPEGGEVLTGEDKDGDGQPDTTVKLPEGGEIKGNGKGGIDVPGGTKITTGENETEVILFPN